MGVLALVPQDGNGAPAMKVATFTPLAARSGKPRLEALKEALFAPRGGFAVR